MIRRVLAGLLGLAGALLLIAVAARPAAADDFSAYTLPGDAVYPEGVAYQAATGELAACVLWCAFLSCYQPEWFPGVAFPHIVGRSIWGG
jgi:hypothetical protein